MMVPKTYRTVGRQTRFETLKRYRRYLVGPPTASNLFLSRKLNPIQSLEIEEAIMLRRKKEILTCNGHHYIFRKRKLTWQWQQTKRASYKPRMHQRPRDILCTEYYRNRDTRHSHKYDCHGLLVAYWVILTRESISIGARNKHAYDTTLSGDYWRYLRRGKGPWCLSQAFVTEIK